MPAPGADQRANPRLLLLRLAGAASAEPRRFPVAVGFDFVRKTGRREYLRCTLDDGLGQPTARRQARDGSAILTAMATCDGFLELDEAVGEVREGAVLPFVPKSEFGL